MDGGEAGEVTQRGNTEPMEGDPRTRDNFPPYRLTDINLPMEYSELIFPLFCCSLVPGCSGVGQMCIICDAQPRNARIIHGRTGHQICYVACASLLEKKLN